MQSTMVKPVRFRTKSITMRRSLTPRRRPNRALIVGVLSLPAAMAQPSRQSQLPVGKQVMKFKSWSTDWSADIRPAPSSSDYTTRSRRAVKTPAGTVAGSAGLGIGAALIPRNVALIGDICRMSTTPKSRVDRWRIVTSPTVWSADIRHVP